MPILFTYYLDQKFGGLSELDFYKIKPMYYIFLIIDYLLFFNGISILFGSRHLVLLAKYIPKEKMIEFTKLSTFCRPYIVKESILDLKRTHGGIMSPFVSIKNKSTNSTYSMNSVGIWTDRKLYNILFPPPVKKERKKEPFPYKKETKNKDDDI